jgi:hypothetical protein
MGCCEGILYSSSEEKVVEKDNFGPAHKADDLDYDRAMKHAKAIEERSGVTFRIFKVV